MDKDLEVFLDTVTEARDQIKHIYESRSVLSHTSDIFVLADDIMAAARILMDRITEYEKQNA